MVTFKAPSTFSDMPVACRLTPLRWVRLRGQLGRLHVVGQDTSAETACFVWQSDRGCLVPGTSPLLFACRVAELYHLRQAVRFPEVLPELPLEIVWLEVSCDDTLSVVLRPSKNF